MSRAESQARYYAKNKEKIAAYHKKWYAKNRESVLAASAKRQKANPELAAARQAAYRARHPDREKAAKAEWYAANRGNIPQSPAGTPGTDAYKKYRGSEKYRRTYANGHLMRKYGISFDDYTRMFNEQGGVCKICKQVRERKYKKERDTRLPLFVDHDHKTGRVRGLLCTLCNFGIGSFAENTATLQEAIRYLKESQN